MSGETWRDGERTVDRSALRYGAVTSQTRRMVSLLQAAGRDDGGAAYQGYSVRESQAHCWRTLSVEEPSHPNISCNLPRRANNS